MALNTPTGQPSNNPSTDFKGASIPNRIGYRFDDLDPGSNIYVQRDDILVIQAISNAPSENISINVRLLTPGREPGRTQPDATTKDNPLGDHPDGEIIAINRMFAPPTNSNVGTTTISLAEGYLLSIAVTSSATGVRGRTYVRALILRGSTSVANASYLLCGDYLSQTAPTGFPFSSYKSPTEGRGWLRSQFIAAQGAGTDPAFATATNTRSSVLAFSGTFTASATVANRTPTIQIQDTINASVFGIYPINTAITAGQVVRVTMLMGTSPVATIATDLFIPISAPIWLSNPANGADGGSQFALVTAGIQAGDQWTNVEFMQEQWYDI